MTRPSYNPSGQNRGIAQLPGFVESVRLLIAREQYCATDVALMFGVTRERIRQLLVKHDIPVHQYPKGLYAVRLWDDTNHRFYPVSGHALYLAALTQKTAERRAIRNAERRRRDAARWANAVAVLRELAAELGRAPTQTELMVRMEMTNLGALVSHLSTTVATQPHTLRRLYADAGLTARSVGGPGHLTPKGRQTHCKRGHEQTPENTVTYNGHRQCRACAIVRNAAYYQRLKERPTVTTRATAW